MTDLIIVGLADAAVVVDVSAATVVVLGDSVVVVFFVVAASVVVVVFASVVAFSFRASGELVVLAISDFVVVLTSAL